MEIITEVIAKREDGSIHHNYYKNHLKQLHGLAIWYWDNGNMMSRENYINDKRDGICTWWDENGKIDKQVMYNNGREINVK